jgi:Fe-S oxidoreductase/nitrate reductase gamma subunit
MPERVDFWGIPESWGAPALFVYSIMFLSAAILILRFYLRARIWVKIGRNDFKFNKLFSRSVNAIKYGIIQIKVLSQRYPGVMHITIAWSFLVFFIGTGLATIDSHFYKILVGTPYLIHKLVMDIFIIVFFFGAGLAVYRRYFQKPERLTLSTGFSLSLILLILIVFGGLVTESLRLAVEKPAWAWWSPVGWILAQLWIALGASNSALINWHLAIWSFHLLIVAITISTLPVGTLLHILTGPIHIFFTDPDKKPGALSPIPENSSNEPIYTSSLNNLSSIQLLSADACTECGRCQDVCPAYAAGSQLNPKKLILNIRDAIFSANKVDGKSLSDHRALIGDWIPEQMLWACTSCMACIQECPVLVNHVGAIVDMRRYLVIEGKMETELQNTLENFGRYGNSFGQSDRMRARWSQNASQKIKDARRDPVEYLWFVGDYASYNPTLTEITLKTAEVFASLGLDFGILFDSERNSGNDVRRIGEEGLFEMLKEKNILSLSKTTCKKIITTDPHTYNTFKNEYSLGNKFQVMHYTELLDQLISIGKLKFSKKLNLKVTYHDPCYLGRYNHVYSAPRRIIQATGCELVEMPRHAERAFCCGAGGGQIWMSTIIMNERPSEIRIREASSLDGVSEFIVACPKDITMFRDAVKTTGFEDKIQVKDLIELVQEAI